MSHATVALLCIALAQSGGADLVRARRAIERQVARSARTIISESVRPLAVPVAPPFQFFTFQDENGRVRGAAVSGDEAVLASDPRGLGRLFAATGLLASPRATEAIEIWRTLEQGGEVLREPDFPAVPPDERAVLHVPRLEPRPAGFRAVAFVRQGEAIFRVQLDADPNGADAAITPLGELLGRDDIAEAIAALRSKDEIIRAAAVSELGGAKDGRALEALIGALADGSPAVRTAAATALGRAGSEDAARGARARAALRGALAKEKDPVARESMTGAAKVLEAPSAE